MNITEQKTTNINIQPQQQFLAMADGINIYQLNSFGFGNGNRVQVGVTLQAYNELKEMCQRYYDKLVELGVIQKEKTPAELQAEQAQMMASMLAVVKDLKAEVEALKNERRNDSRDVEVVAGESESA